MRPSSLEDQSAQNDHCPLRHPTSRPCLPLYSTFHHSLCGFWAMSSEIRAKCAEFVEFNAAEKLLLAPPHPVCLCKLQSQWLVVSFPRPSLRPFSLPSTARPSTASWRAILYMGNLTGRLRARCLPRRTQDET